MHLSNTRTNLVSFESLYLGLYELTVRKSWKWSQVCHTVFGLDVAGRLVDNAFYVKLTEDQVRISLNRTFMYFPWLFILPLFLKVHKNSHSMVKWLFFLI